MDVAPLVRAVAAALLFLENSAEDQLDPDWAVQGMEGIAYELLQMPDRDRAEFLRAIESVAEQEANPRTASFIRALPFAIGMTEA